MILIQELLDKLAPFEVEDSEAYFYGVYELKNGSLY